ncbi:metal ABC transporter solute-binding protein, Zn/Mn family [Mycolicibacterium stellerae]|uniref:metal ABC transporter solute-binding protein, Zn/Mn family n=1 Tax=Mycolicibacterium stellerae TaxID=2358193 RepID=UPI001F2150B2|nr:zinc ABC transporter substrate-binding protein [Mycolicibacterium stellerae]
MGKSAIRFAVGLTVAALAAAGCSQDAPGHDRDAVSIVASTDVWGSVASAVAGTHASVKSIESGPSADPHSFEATPADIAEISDASLLVYNGGGYDHWVDDVIAADPEIDAVDAYSLRGTNGPDNEHVFYDLSIAKAVADEIAKRLADIDSAHADEYRSNASQFGKQADDIAASERAIGKAHPSGSVVATEPVAYYMLRNAGITDRTPPGFASAVEEGDDPAPADVAAMLDLINSHQVSVLLFNSQTETAATKQIQEAARRASLPVVTVTETLPQGVDYLTWQRDTVDQLAGQFDKSAQANR